MQLFPRGLWGKCELSVSLLRLLHIILICLLWRQKLKRKNMAVCVWCVCVCPLCRCLLGWWMEKRSQRMGCVQGAFPHSPACQRWYLSASNRGTGEDRQHLLSKPNYLLSTKQEAEPAPPPALWSATLTLHIRAQLWFFIHSLTDGKLGG